MQLSCICQAYVWCFLVAMYAASSVTIGTDKTSPAVPEIVFITSSATSSLFMIDQKGLVVGIRKKPSSNETDDPA